MKSKLERIRECNDLNDVTMAHEDGTQVRHTRSSSQITSLILIQKSNKKVKVNLNRQWKKTE